MLDSLLESIYFGTIGIRSCGSGASKNLVL